MAEQDFFEFSAKFDVEIEKSSMSQATKVLDDFYKKYSNRKMKVDTSEMVSTAQKGIAAVQKLYRQGIDDAAKGNISWWQIEDGLEDQFDGARAKMAEFWKDAKLVFSDGSIFSALDENLSEVLSEKFAKGITVVAADLGERIQYLKAQISNVVDGLKDINAVQIGWNGKTRGFAGDDMSEGQLRNRIALLEELAECQRELELFDGKEFSYDNSPVGMPTKRINYEIESMQTMLNELKEYNDKVEEQYKITTKQFQRRQELINRVGDSDYWDQQEAIKNIDDDESYNEALSSLKYYIESRQSLIEELKNSELELFRDGGVDQYIAQVEMRIKEYQGYIDELVNTKNGKDGPGIGINFSEVVEQLREIKNAINEIKSAFEPLTKALSSEDNALHKMLTASVDDLNTLSNKLNEVYQMINTISNKQFNVTNVMSSGNGTQNDIEQIREFRKEAKAVFKQVEELYAESMTTAQKIKGTSGGLESVLNFTDTMSDFDMTDLARRIKSRSAVSLGIVIDELNEWKKVLLQFNALRNNVEAGSFNVDKYNDTSSKVKVGSRTTDADDQTITDDTQVEDNDILNKVKTLSEQVQAEFVAIRSKMEETFNFATLDPKVEHIKAITDAIYQQFVELQTKINALDLNLNIPVAAVTDTKSDESAIDDTAKAMNNEGKSAEDAVPKKDAFTEANKKAAESAKETEEATKLAAEGIEAEAKAIEQSAGAVVDANDKLDKVKYVTTDGQLKSKTETSTRVRENAIETTSTSYKYDADGDVLSETETIVRDFKKRASELKKEADKIALAQKIVDKFVSQFKSKTAGQASTIKGFDSLKDFKIENLDDIEKATQMMIDLDSEYNKVTKSFRQGTKSMNPFVNAITGIDEMENKVKETEIAFDRLNTKPDELSQDVIELTTLLANVQSFISEDANGNKVITDIYGLSDAYGKLNVALRQVNSNINVQKKIDTSKYKDVSFGLDLEKQLSALTKQQAQWAKNGQLTDELRLKIEAMFDSLAEVTNSSELANWKKQWSILKDEVAETKYQMDAAKKAQSQNNYGKTIYNRESKYYDTINANVRNMEADNLSDDFIKKIGQYEEAYQRLKSLRTEIENNPIANDSVIMQNAYQDAALEVEQLRKEIMGTVKEAQKLDRISPDALIGTAKIDTDKFTDAKSAMIDFAASVTNGQFKFEGFNAAGTEMYGTLNKGAGVIEKVTIALKAGTDQLYAYKSGTKQASSSWQQLGASIKKGAAQLATMYLGFHDIIRYVRQGLTYVKDIDLAMTELKKVTDETEDTYKDFLKTASSTASVIGSTVSDFTDATAAFARLG